MRIPYNDLIRCFGGGPGNHASDSYLIDLLYISRGTPMMGYWSHVYKLRSDLQQEKGVGACRLLNLQ